MRALKSIIAEFSPDDSDLPAVALRVDFKDYEAEIPTHSHRKGQMILALHGAVTCVVSGSLWIVPPNCAVWIPGGLPHNNRATANARLTYLFVEPAASTLPRECCILSVSPVVRELVHRLAEVAQPYETDSHEGRLVRVLLDELASMPKEQFGVPVSVHPKIAELSRALTDNPADRRTLADWARHLAMSERSLNRLMQEQTGLSLGRWRQQVHLLLALRELAGGAPVQTVSEVLGYDSVTAFITMFKKATGRTPARYFRREQ